ncbi:MAG: hypothetical protein HND53_03370 [Proteobacteria bacterium]|nr:hypothetical protein [Pseudomonadota bacterium]NOG59513.1 hypothetical protein [Pseudomonadota bacterium]
MATNLAVDELIEKDSYYKILNEVRQITDETGLLALNAVFEAARIGETGRDFADEVRQLSLISNKLKNELSDVLDHHNQN